MSTNAGTDTTGLHFAAQKETESSVQLVLGATRVFIAASTEQFLRPCRPPEKMRQTWTTPFPVNVKPGTRRRSSREIPQKAVSDTYRVALDSLILRGRGFVPPFAVADVSELCS